MKTSAIILNSYPQLIPSNKNVDFVRIKLDSCSFDDILVRIRFLSVDPYMRNRLRAEGTNYIAQLEIGKPIVSMGIGEVIESKTTQFKPGDIVIGMFPWQEFAVMNAKLVKSIQKNDMPITAQLGILGYPGLTAYIGVCKIAKPVHGQTFFISAAAGAVGSLAGQ